MNKSYKLLLILTFFYFSSYTSQAQLYEAEFQRRADTLLKGVADNYTDNPDGTFTPCGTFGDFGKLHYPKMMSVFNRYGFTRSASIPNSFKVDSMNSRLKKFSTCPTFHFNLIGLVRLLYQFKDAQPFKDSSIVKNYLDNVFSRTDSYNAFTGEGTENHTNMNRTSGYLYAQYALEKYPASYPTAAARKDSMKTWILYSAKRVLEVGTGEWNSSIYGGFNLVGWLNLYDFATDSSVKQASRAVLDYYTSELALHYYLGMTSGPEMRGPAKISIDKEADFFSWLWFGRSPKNITPNTFILNRTITPVFAALSSYRPSDIAVKLGKKLLTNNTMYYNSKPSYHMDQASYVKQTFYLGKDYTLGAAYLPYGGWASGDFQMCSWKLVSRVDSSNAGNAQYISGQGGTNTTGNYRYPFDQIVHHKNVIIQMTKVPINAATLSTDVNTKFNNWQNAWQNDFSSRFPGDSKGNPVFFQNPSVAAANNSSFVSVSTGGTVSSATSTSVTSVRIITLEKTYLLVRSIRGAGAPAFTSNLMTDNGLSLGTLCGFVIEVVNRSDYATLALLNTAIATTSLNKVPASDSLVYKNIAGEFIGVRFQNNGTFTEPIYDWGYGPTTPSVKQTSPPFIQPTWPSGAGHGKIATWGVNSVRVDLNTPWSVYNGANLTVNNSVLTLIDGSCNYKVDYSGTSPVFTSSSCTALAQQTINSSTLPDSILLTGGNVALTASSSSTLGLTYSLLSGSTNATLSGSTLTPVANGFVTIKIVQKGNNSYFPSIPVYKIIKIYSLLTKITTDTLIKGSPFCAGAVLKVPFTTNGTFVSGNIFKAQLSDSSGSFASPINIGSLTSTSADTISATIPSGSFSGNSYKIRVIATNPSIIGTDNKKNLIINLTKTPVITVSPNVTSTCFGTKVVFTASITNGGVSPIYQWKKNNTNVGLNSINYSDSLLLSSDFVKCILTSNAICLSSTKDTSANSSVAIKSATSSTTNLSICTSSLPFSWNGISFTTAGSQTKTGLTNKAGCDSSAILVLTVNNNPSKPIISIIGADSLVSTLNNQYQWLVNGNIILNQTLRSYKVVSGGYYQVEVTDNNGCKSKSDSISISITGFKNTKKIDLKPISIYPNPVSKGSNISILNSTDGQKFQIIDFKGVIVTQLLSKNEIESLELNLSSGMYLMKIIDVFGIISYQKIVVN